MNKRKRRKVVAEGAMAGGDGLYCGEGGVKSGA
jgi:hypothetical protein